MTACSAHPRRRAASRWVTTGGWSLDRALCQACTRDANPDPPWDYTYAGIVAGLPTYRRHVTATMAAEAERAARLFGLIA